MSAPGLPAIVLGLWLASVLGWWAFAFMPLPSAPPAWLTAARDACFGTAERGLPAAYGWMMLVLAPAGLLAGIVVLWGSEVAVSLRQMTRRRAGQCLLAAVAVALVVEGSWVATKVRTAAAVATWDDGVRDQRSVLPSHYPQSTRPAPDFALVDQHGRRIALQSLRGRPVAVTFVYAHCQTMCPLVVDTLKQAVPAGPATVLIVTLDPWRDTPGALPGIARQWDVPANFHVLSSRSVEEVARVVDAYQVPFQRDETSGEIAHPGLVFLVDPRGRLAYTFNNPPAAWVRDGLHRMARADDEAG
jgi:cytochrome oxidase Cu insertion factor (SCO1/SenC/PrrC family)